MGWFFLEGGLEEALEPVTVLVWMCYSDSAQAIVPGEVTPNSFAQQERFKNRKVHRMRPSEGEALALDFFPAGSQALPVFLWLLSNSRIWHMVFRWKDALTQHCLALKAILILGKEEGWGRN